MNSRSRLRLTKEERQIERDLAAGKYRSLGPEVIADHIQWAREEVRRRPELKAERVNIRLTSAELRELKERAEREGLPYQSLIASVLHKYLNGSLVEITSVAAMKRVLKAL